MAANTSVHQYEPLRMPENWSPAERKLILQLTDIFDDIYRRYGRLRFEDLGDVLKTRITSTEGIVLEVSNERIFRAESEAVLVAALGAMAPPIEMAAGLLWMDTTANLVKRCTDIGPPIAWANVQADELHAAGIDIGPGTVAIWASAAYNMVAGSGANAVGMSNNRVDSYFMWAGDEDPAQAPFSVKMDGTIQNVSNVYVQNACDNADATHGIVLDVFFPSDVSLVDKCLLSVKFAAFRAYETGAASGGAVSETSGSGGGQTKTSNAGSGDTGLNATGTSTGATDNQATGSMAASKNTGASSGNTGTTDCGGGMHDHSLNGHTHSLTDHSHAGSGSHSHALTQHTHAIGSHSHSVTVDDHSHSITIAAHNHDMTYGIYEGTTPSSCTVKVDGTNVAGLVGVAAFTLADIASAFSKTGGKITRDAFHTVEIIPNTLGRISAHLYIKTTQVSKVAGAL